MKTKTLLYFIVLAVFAFSQSGCISVTRGAIYVDPADNSSIQRDIKVMQDRLDKTTIPDEAAVIHFKLGLLYSCYNNKSPNYRKSIMHLNHYLMLMPKGVNAHIALDRISLLEDVIAMKAQNNFLREKLKKLTELDMLMENKKNNGM
ncbi:MAG: hypothetical protein KAR06_05950 [Deltaproteobacteria bacterium]|nr:hypothetical protein [Deltaproteobacteria bacterium]